MVALGGRPFVGGLVAWSKEMIMIEETKGGF